MKLRTLFISLLAALMCAVSVCAAGVGYILQTAEPITDEDILVQVEPVCEAICLYRTDDYSVVERLESCGQLVEYSVDEPVSLLDLSQDVTRLRSMQWSHAMIGLDYARQNSLHGTGVRVAMIDSGLRPDFASFTDATVLQGVNYLADKESDARSDTSDSVGHGTFVAGVIASNAVGAATEAELVPLRCFDSRTTSSSYIISAVYDAVDLYNCDVINFSLGSAADNSFLRAAVAYAYEHGVIMVAASGNLKSGEVSGGNDTLYYPAAYDEVIGVGAVNAVKTIGSFSVQNSSVFVAAPGVSVKGVSLTGSGYTTGSGTSYAVPYVVASAALAKEADPGLTPDRFMALLRESAEDAGPAGFDNTYGYGILNTGLLLAAARGDDESLILSLCGSTPYISLYQPDRGTACRALMTTYEASGRFIRSAALARSDGALFLSNYPLADTETAFSVFCTAEGSYSPLSPAKGYR